MGSMGLTTTGHRWDSAKTHQWWQWEGERAQYDVIQGCPIIFMGSIRALQHIWYFFVFPWRGSLWYSICWGVGKYINQSFLYPPCSYNWLKYKQQQWNCCEKYKLTPLVIFSQQIYWLECPSKLLEFKGTVSREKFSNLDCGGLGYVLLMCRIHL